MPPLDLKDKFQDVKTKKFNFFYKTNEYFPLGFSLNFLYSGGK